MPAGKATIDTDGVELLVRFSFAPKITEEIKARIPTAYRSWDANEKAWRVSKLYADTVFDILDEAYFATRDFTGSEPAAKLRQNEHYLRAKQRRQKNVDRDLHDSINKERREQQRKDRKETAEQARERERMEAEDAFGDGRYVGAGPEEYAFWRLKFRNINPGLRDSDFVKWWDFFVEYGTSTMANKAFKKSRTERRQYGQYTYDPLRDGEFGSWWRARFSQNNGSQGTKALDPYTVLSIVRGCSKQEAQRAYVALAQQYHPSSSYTGRTPDEAKMKTINNARDSVWQERGWT